MLISQFKSLTFLAILISSFFGTAFCSEINVHIKNDTTWTLKVTHNGVDSRFDAGTELQLIVKQGDSLTAKTSGFVWNKLQWNPHDLTKGIDWDNQDQYAQITISGGKGKLDQFGAFVVDVKMMSTVAAIEKELVQFDIVSRFTNPTDAGPQFESLYLANIPVRSEGANVLNRFKLVRVPEENSLIYVFESTNGLKDEAVTARFTPWNEDGGGNTTFLDRHIVACEPNEAITRFQLAYDIATSQIRYEYGCRNVNLKNLTTYETEFNDDGKGKNIYLDRHDVKCPGNTVLNSFQLVRNDDQTQYKYVFKCGEIS